MGNDLEGRSYRGWGHVAFAPDSDPCPGPSPTVWGLLRPFPRMCFGNKSSLFTRPIVALLLLDIFFVF